MKYEAFLNLSSKIRFISMYVQIRKALEASSSRLSVCVLWYLAHIRTDLRKVERAGFPLRFLSLDDASRERLIAALSPNLSWKLQKLQTCRRTCRHAESSKKYSHQLNFGCLGYDGLEEMASSSTTDRFSRDYVCLNT